MVMVETIYHFNFHEDKQPMATESFYLSGDESEISTPCISPNHCLPGQHHDSNDAFNQLTRLCMSNGIRTTTLLYLARLLPTPLEYLTMKDKEISPT